MLGLLLLFFLARSLYKMAEEKERNKWLWGLAAIVAYYAGGAIVGLLGVLFFGMTEGDFTFGIELILGLGGGLALWGVLYYILNRLPAAGTALTIDTLDSNLTQIKDDL